MMKMYVWTGHFSFLAVAQAPSVAEARKQMLLEMGEPGDGSCREMDEARNEILEQQPAIYIGSNAEFCLSHSAQQEARRESLLRKLDELKEALKQV